MAQAAALLRREVGAYETVNVFQLEEQEVGVDRQQNEQHAQGQQRSKETAQDAPGATGSGQCSLARGLAGLALLFLAEGLPTGVQHVRQAAWRFRCVAGGGQLGPGSRARLLPVRAGAVRRQDPAQCFAIALGEGLHAALDAFGQILARAQVRHQRAPLEHHGPRRQGQQQTPCYEDQVDRRAPPPAALFEAQHQGMHDVGAQVTEDERVQDRAHLPGKGDNADSDQDQHRVAHGGREALEHQPCSSDSSPASGASPGASPEASPVSSSPSPSDAPSSSTGCFGN